MAQCAPEVPFAPSRHCRNPGPWLNLAQPGLARRKNPRPSAFLRRFGAAWFYFFCSIWFSLAQLGSARRSNDSAALCYCGCACLSLAHVGSARLSARASRFQAALSTWFSLARLGSARLDCAWPFGFLRGSAWPWPSLVQVGSVWLSLAQRNLRGALRAPVVLSGARAVEFSLAHPGSSSLRAAPRGSLKPRATGAFDQLMFAVAQLGSARLYPRLAAGGLFRAVSAHF